MLSSVVGNQNILILSNGEFGERLHAISQIHNESTSLLQFPWGDSIDLEIVNTYLQSHRVDFIALVHHETSSGMLNPLAAIGALARANGAVLLVDCVSSVGAESIDMERDNIAFCSGSSSKAIGSYPGLSFVIGKTDEFEKLRTLPAKSAYLNLYRFFEFATGRSQTPNTPAVPLFFALDQALANILIEGVPQRRAKILRTATTLREEMKELGLSFLLKSEDMSSVLTTAFVPPYVDIDLFRQRLREKSIIIYEGKGPLKDRVFQVGNIGELSETDVAQFSAVLRDTLDVFHAVEIITTTILPHSVIDPGVLPSLALDPIFATSGVLNTTGGLFRTGDGEQLMAIPIDLDPLISEVTESV